MEHAYDFYKPNLHSEYPEVDGPLSNQCYTRAVDICYHRYIEKLSHFLNHKASLNNIDHFLFHSPYIKLVQKSFGRLKFNDFKRDPSSNEFNSINQKYLELCDKQSYVDRTLVETFVDLTKIDYASKTLPSLLVAKNIGNMYCASLYGGLCSLLSNPESKFVIGNRALS
jgi:hydroxymethylglutaryl-CoA synthase